jgi:hypothetical protein
MAEESTDTTTETTDDTHAVVTAETPPAKSKTELDFDARMTAFGAKDVELKDRETALAATMARLGPLGQHADKLSPHAERLIAIAAALEAGDDAAAARALYGKKLNLDTLTVLANLPEVVGDDKPTDPEELFEKKWAEKEAAKKVADEKAAADAKAAKEKADTDRLQAETSSYLGEVRKYIKANTEAFPWIAAMDGEVDHEALFVQVLNDHIAETAKATGKPEVLEPDALAEKVEARYRAIYQRTPFAPKAKKEPSFEDELEAMARRVQQQKRSPDARPMTLDQKIMAELDAGDAAAIQQRRRASR